MTVAELIEALKSMQDGCAWTEEEIRSAWIEFDPARENCDPTGYWTRTQTESLGAHVLGNSFSPCRSDSVLTTESGAPRD